MGGEQPDPGAWLRRYGGNIFLSRSWNGDGLVFGRSVGTNANATFLNFWGVNGDVSHSFETLDDIDTRGGPPILDPADTSAYLNINSDSRKSWRLLVFANGTRRDEGGGMVGSG